MVNIKLLAALLFSLSVLRADPFSELIKLDGQPLQDSQAQKRLVVFWATWCKSCKDKLTSVLPEWNKQSELEVISVNIDSDLKRVKNFLSKSKVKLPIYREKNQYMQKKWNIYSVPYWLMFERVKGEWKLIANNEGFDQAKIYSLLSVKPKKA